jgi:hypothetical protein
MTTLPDVVECHKLILKFALKNTEKNEDAEEQPGSEANLKPSFRVGLGPSLGEYVPQVLSVTDYVRL